MPGANPWRTLARLTLPYLRGTQRRTALALLAAITALTLGGIAVNVRLNAWNGEFFNALQDKDFDGFRWLLLEFCGWAFLYIVMSVYELWFRRSLQIRWRAWLTERYVGRWMRPGVQYPLSLSDRGADNPDQRIAEDLRNMVDDSVSLAFGLLTSIVSLLAFVGLLWTLSGAFTAFGVTIPGYMVWVALGYALIGSVLAHRIGAPLRGLNFRQERLEADFRYGMVRARENAEGIALTRGEPHEARGFLARFGAVAGNWWEMMRAQKRFVWFESFYGQLASVFPFLVASPHFFSGAITLGALMQTANAFSEVQKALSWFIEAYVRVASWQASLDRLDGFARALDETRHTPAALQGQEGGEVDLADILVRAGGRLLWRGQGLQVRVGEHLVVTGPSGCGKTTLLRVVAGIWPEGEGVYRRPADSELMALPQRPYLPLGTLREVFGYGLSEVPGDDAIRHWLEVLDLGELGARLDEEQPWAQRLSPGEQQRLAIVRALLHRPRWLLLDEATSALDVETETRIYRLLREALPETTLISVAHRIEVVAHHVRELALVPQADRGEGARFEDRVLSPGSSRRPEERRPRPS